MDIVSSQYSRALNVWIRFQSKHGRQKLLVVKLTLEISKVTCLGNLLLVQSSCGGRGAGRGEEGGSQWSWEISAAQGAQIGQCRWLFFFFFLIFIYLALLGLPLGMQDLHLQHVNF